MKGLLSFGVVGTVVAALCCAGILTPLLVALLAVLGLGVVTDHLDAVLLPALAGFIALSGFAYWRLRRPTNTERTLP
jgi:mercuric ion transport protein